jgi:hypothetical protein
MVSPRAQVSHAIRQQGAARVARTLGLSREAVLQYAGDFGERSGTEAQVLRNLHRLSDEPTSSDPEQRVVEREGR